ncbi:YifB family Mg chelatase-like AAA ATPase [Myceligenerans crystallogenes]|uniref:YifB family Mg chelatase-like AAA ATPase n=1 Tax=Myceligenerans crystallogenes TaxID=316335 RepID=A0ABP4ZUC7_9MICO
MEVATTAAVSLVGLEGHMVQVQAHLSATVPGFTVVGLPDAALSESRDRVRAAVSSTGLAWPVRKITVNLSPAALRKQGSGYDLAIAVAILAGAGEIPAGGLDSVVHLGELGLDGRIQPVRGVLPAVAAAVDAGYERIVVAASDAPEARLVPGARVVGAASLAEVVALHGGEGAVVREVERVERPRAAGHTATPGDMSDVVGQAAARRALEVAAAGGHHVFFVGPPGSGKTMLASRLPGILPDLTERHAVEVTAVHSVAGTFDPAGGLIRRPPYEAPHHTATQAAVVGGGSGLPRPGAATRAHRGILFLDEVAEFRPSVLDTLRQPLEQGELVIHRSGGVARYPARFQMVLAANPCPCGKSIGKGLECTCTPVMRRRYFGRLSGPLLDRVDLQIEVQPVDKVDRAGGAGEPTAVVARRVAAAREAAAARLRGTGWTTNSEVPGRWLRERLRTTKGIENLMDRALADGTLSLRGVDRVLRVAWTLADLAGRDAPVEDDVLTAVTMRQGLRHG